jgi:hypothetical protein
MAGIGFRVEDSRGFLDLPLGMNFLMTVGAQRDQICFGIVAEPPT